MSASLVAAEDKPLTLLGKVLKKNAALALRKRSWLEYELRD